jgi:hypothetical protein
VLPIRGRKHVGLRAVLDLRAQLLAARRVGGHLDPRVLRLELLGQPRKRVLERRCLEHHQLLRGRGSGAPRVHREHRRGQREHRCDTRH